MKWGTINRCVERVEYSVGFRYQVNSAEYAKSEMIKLFQEVWEREQGYFFTDSLPPYTKYAEDLLRFI